MNNYLIEYLNENEFRKRERSIKKYNMFLSISKLKAKIFTKTVVKKIITDITIKEKITLRRNYVKKSRNISQWWRCIRI